LAKYVVVLVQNDVNKISTIAHLKTYLKHQSYFLPLKHDYKDACFRRGIKPDQCGVVCLLYSTWDVLEPMEPIRWVVNYEDWHTSSKEWQ